MKLRVVGTMMTAAWWLGAAQAHHSVAMFDINTQIMVEGTVKEFQWTNPHVWLQIMAADKTGAIVEQGFEIGAPNTLIRDGFRKDSFKPGDQVKVIARARKDGTVGGLYLCGRTAAGRWLTFGMGADSVPPEQCHD